MVDLSTENVAYLSIWGLHIILCGSIRELTSEGSGLFRGAPGVWDGCEVPRRWVVREDTGVSRPWSVRGVPKDCWATWDLENCEECWIWGGGQTDCFAFVMAFDPSARRNFRSINKVLKKSEKFFSSSWLVTTKPVGKNSLISLEVPCTWTLWPFQINL